MHNYSCGDRNQHRNSFNLQRGDPTSWEEPTTQIYSRSQIMWWTWKFLVKKIVQFLFFFIWTFQFCDLSRWKCYIGWRMGLWSGKTIRHDKVRHQLYPAETVQGGRDKVCAAKSPKKSHARSWFGWIWSAWRVAYGRRRVLMSCKMIVLLF